MIENVILNLNAIFPDWNGNWRELISSQNLFWACKLWSLSTSMYWEDGCSLQIRRCFSLFVWNAPGPSMSEITRLEHQFSGRRPLVCIIMLTHVKFEYGSLTTTTFKFQFAGSTVITSNEYFIPCLLTSVPQAKMKGALETRTQFCTWIPIYKGHYYVAHRFTWVK